MSEHCRVTPETLSAFVDGELPVPDRRWLAQHIATCDSCSQQIGKMYALKVYVGCTEEKTEQVPVGFWQRVRRRLNEVDSVADKIIGIRPRPVLGWRLAALAAAGVLLVAVAIGVRDRLTPHPSDWSDLAHAHRAIAARIISAPPSPGRRDSLGQGLTEVLWQPAHIQAIRTQMCSGQQAVYFAHGAIISHFSMPCDSLDVSTLTQVHDAGRRFYIDATAELSMVAWRTGTGWSAMIGNLYVEQLFALAKHYAGPAHPSPGF